jgi:pimeloyl-ACP methyl ester carboxylesterase
MTTWVLLRGLIRDSRHWGEFPSLFQEVLGEGAVVTLDFPGNGSLHAQQSAATVEAMAGNIREQLTQRGYPPPYCVLALSLGAMVAVAWSNLYPAEIERLVLINTSLAPYSHFYHRLRPKNYASLMRLLIAGDAVQREALILHLTSNQPHPGLLEQWQAYARQYPVTRANMLRQLFAASRYRASRPSVPVLLLASREDHLVNVQCSLTLAKRWHTPVQLHPAAGHDLPLDDPRWVTHQVRAWLRGENRP